MQSEEGSFRDMHVGEEGGRLSRVGGTRPDHTAIKLHREREKGVKIVAATVYVYKENYICTVDIRVL